MVNWDGPSPVVGGGEGSLASNPFIELQSFWPASLKPRLVSLRTFITAHEKHESGRTIKIEIVTNLITSQFMLASQLLIVGYY